MSMIIFPLNLQNFPLDSDSFPNLWTCSPHSSIIFDLLQRFLYLYQKITQSNNVQWLSPFLQYSPSTLQFVYHHYSTETGLYEAINETAINDLFSGFILKSIYVDNCYRLASMAQQSSYLFQSPKQLFPCLHFSDCLNAIWTPIYFNRKRQSIISMNKVVQLLNGN